jgi:hypothetical protein
MTTAERQLETADQKYGVTSISLLARRREER